MLEMRNGDTLTAVMSGAAATTNPRVLVMSKSDIGLKSDWVALAGASTSTLFTGGPNDKPFITGLSLTNNDSAAITVTITHTVNGTASRLTKKTLQVDDTLTYKDGVFTVSDINGQLRASSVPSALTDSNGNELIKTSAVASAVNEITVANAATGNSPSISATGGDTDINLTLTPKGAGFNISDGPFQIRDSVAVTATVGGGTTGLIPAGSSLVVVTSDNADKQISLPAAVVGDEISILVGATGCELISAVAAHKVNDVVVGATNEAALTATNLYVCKYVATNTWVVVGYTKLGAVQAALVPDAL